MRIVALQHYYIMTTAIKLYGQFQRQIRFQSRSVQLNTSQHLVSFRLEFQDSVLNNKLLLQMEHWNGVEFGTEGSQRDRAGAELLKKLRRGSAEIKGWG
jgi:hypothetical protein